MKLKIVEQDLIIPLMADNNEVVAYELRTPEREGESMIVARTSDGKARGLKVFHIMKNANKGFIGKSSDNHAIGIQFVCCVKALAETVTNSANRVWDLTPYQEKHQAYPCSYWRLIEVGACYPRGYPWYGAGCVNQEGVLCGLQDEFRGNSYNGYMELQIGCPMRGNKPEDEPYQIKWPGDCQNCTDRDEFSC